jgi:hypothetical protein
MCCCVSLCVVYSLLGNAHQQILADCYKKREDAPFSERGPRILNELRSVMPDVICLQGEKYRICPPFLCSCYVFPRVSFVSVCVCVFCVCAAVSALGCAGQAGRPVPFAVINMLLDAWPSSAAVSHQWKKRWRKLVSSGFAHTWRRLDFVSLALSRTPIQMVGGLMFLCCLFLSETLPPALSFLLFFSFLFSFFLSQCVLSC